MFLGKVSDAATNVFEAHLSAMCNDGTFEQRPKFQGYPTPEVVKQYRGLASRTTGPAFEEGRVAFVGQVPFDLPDEYLAWAVDTLCGEYACRHVKIIAQGGCARVWFIDPTRQFDLFKSKSEFLLFDVCGVWMASNATDAKQLVLCAKTVYSRISAGSESRVARSPMTIELAGRHAGGGNPPTPSQQQLPSLSVGYPHPQRHGPLPISTTNILAGDGGILSRSLNGLFAPRSANASSGPSPPPTEPRHGALGYAGGNTPMLQLPSDYGAAGATYHGSGIPAPPLHHHQAYRHAPHVLQQAPAVGGSWVFIPSPKPPQQHPHQPQQQQQPAASQPWIPPYVRFGC